MAVLCDDLDAAGPGRRQMIRPGHHHHLDPLGDHGEHVPPPVTPVVVDDGGDPVPARTAVAYAGIEPTQDLVASGTVGDIDDGVCAGHIAVPSVD